MRQTMRQFIADCLLVSEKQDLYGVKRCSGFSLVHMRGGQQVELKTVRIGSRSWDTKELAQLFESVAENFAGGVPGVQQFQLLAFYDDQDQPQSFYPFRKAGEQEGDGIVTEGPTGTGPMAQMMRHYEADRRITTQYASTLFSYMERLLDKAGKRIEQLEQQEQDAIELAKTVVMEQSQKQHERRIEIMKLERAEKDRDTIVKLLPAVANRVLGKEIIPQSDADSAIIEHLADTLEPDQVQKLAAVLRPEQWALIADRVLQVLDSKAKREKAREEATKTAGADGIPRRDSREAAE